MINFTKCTRVETRFNYVLFTCVHDEVVKHFQNGQKSIFSLNVHDRAVERLSTIA